MRRALPEELIAHPLQAVRARCAEVAARAAHVRIDAAALRAWTDALPPGALRSPPAALLPRGADEPEARAAWVLQLDAVNFGSGWFPSLRKLPGKSGYRTIEARLSARFERDGASPAAQLASADPAWVAQLLEQDLASEPIRELMELFATAWRDLGRLVETRFAGSFLALVESAAHSVEALLRVLLEMPLYRDIARYGELEVPFFKRGQITAADLSRALAGDLGRFHDLSRLTIFADNLVPHVLRLDGVLVYEDALIQRIEREELLPAGSAEEVEIRACGVHAAEQIVARLREGDPALRSMDLDSYLWERGAGPRYKARPRHRTRCPYY